MRRKVFVSVFGTAFALLLAAGLAQAKTKEINLAQPARLGDGPELQPGSYRIELVRDAQKPELIFYRDRTEVARAPAKLVEEPSKASRTEIHFNLKDNKRVLTQMRVEGWRERVVFTKPGEDSQAGQ
jgi:hypothetical protein